MLQDAGKLVSLLATLMLASCSAVVPRFDVPYAEGTPTAHSIGNRIVCELKSMISDGSTDIGKIMLTDDVVVAVQLTLTVNDAGSLTPSMIYNNLYPAGLFTVNAGATLGQSREQNFWATLHYTMRELANEVIADRKENLDTTKCEIGNTNLAGNLGLRTTIDMALSLYGDLDWNAKFSNSSGTFGGYVTFVVTKNANAGPTWALRHVTGPGNIIGLSEVNTDKLTFAFVRGEGAFKPYSLAKAFERADRAIDQINLNQLSTQLGSINQFNRANFFSF